MKKPGFIVIFAALCLAGSAAQAARTSAPRGAHRAPTARIVSLIPSFTEDLFALGAGPDIVGVDEISTDIPGARKLPIVSNFSSINAERIVALHPTLIVGIPAQDRLLQPLRRAGIRRELFPDDSFEDIFVDIKALGDLTGRADAARHLEQELRLRTKALHARIRYRRVPSVFVVLDTNPIYTAGRHSYISTLIEMAGGRNAAQALPSAYASYSAEALLRLQPDALITDKSTGLANVLQNEPWRSLRAVAQHHVFTVEPAAILERPGPRYNEGLSWLIQNLQALAP